MEVGEGGRVVAAGVGVLCPRAASVTCRLQVNADNSRTIRMYAETSIVKEIKRRGSRMTSDYKRRGLTGISRQSVLDREYCARAPGR